MGDPVQAYLVCMEDLKRRLAIVRSIASGEFSVGDDFDNYELLSVHLRKSLECLAFASMSANKDAYSQARAAFARDWRAKDILDRLDRIHPDFYPKPVVLDYTDDNGFLHFDFVEHGHLTRDDFATLYDLCSQLMHAWNPFTERERHVDFGISVEAWTAKIERLLSMHLLRFVDRDEIWVVVMHDPSDGKVHVSRASPS
jgi:hypothetical protein